MSERQAEVLVKWTDLLFKWAVVLGPLLLAFSVSYLKEIFVSKAEFEKMSPRVEMIERTILLMANQQKVLDDHEERIRWLEKKSVVTK